MTLNLMKLKKANTDMPDISKCSGESCPLKEDCFRYKSPPSQLQSYFMAPPVIDGKCRYFIQNPSYLHEKYKIENEHAEGRESRDQETDSA